jgi:hypothetical protein
LKIAFLTFKIQLYLGVPLSTSVQPVALLQRALLGPPPALSACPHYCLARQLISVKMAAARASLDYDYKQTFLSK